MIEDEDEYEEDEEEDDVPECVICNAEKYWECGHLVASFDLSFNECRGGSFCNRIREFSNLIEKSFIGFIKNDIKPSFEKSVDTYKWEELFKYCKESYEGDGSSIDLDDDMLKQIYIELLEEAGAFNIGVIDDGGPRMTSVIELLFEDQPEKTVDKAFASLTNILLQSPHR